MIPFYAIAEAEFGPQSELGKHRPPKSLCLQVPPSPSHESPALDIVHVFVPTMGHRLVSQLLEKSLSV